LLEKSFGSLGYLDTRPQLLTDVKFSSSDSLSSKSSLLDVNASLKASFLGGLVEVGGSAKYLRDTKSSNQQSRVTYPQVFDQKTATHVITAVLYGAQAFMVFDRTFSDDENHQEIEGELHVMVKSIPGFSIEGQGAVEMTDGHKEKAKNITCTFHGDVHLKQNPTTYMEALEVYRKFPTLLGNSAVPIKVWLYPLSLLNTVAAQLVREISTRLISNTEDMIEELGEVERKCNDLSRKPMANIFSDIKERLRLFQNSIRIYRLVLQKALARVLPAIRGGGMKEKSLDDILKIYYLSPFNTVKGIKIEDSEGLIISLLDPDIDVVVCLTFTSLKYNDPYLSTLNEFLKSVTFKELDGENTFSLTSPIQKPFNPHDVTSKMRENLSHFKSFSEANKDEKTIHYIISTISDASNPGSSIYLYEKGKLTDKKFQPVSKPPPPIVKNILDQTVSLKLQKSPTGETVKYRVEYKEVKANAGAEEQWLVIDTAYEDFTLTGLKFGMQYLIRYRIVGKVGVSEASDAVSSRLSLGKYTFLCIHFLFLNLPHSHSQCLDFTTVPFTQQRDGAYRIQLYAAKIQEIGPI
uniref:Fibronectin type-III domain-containing protein n=1 Tax=Sinocyclocheilus anshuiensis TaxID=1608454 RepID=A0A671NRM5_9TELE